jgi:EAL domain-containing protein (putative c-di-GMP-specific phosphodiesterase class I)
VRAAVTLAHDLGLSVVAEGAEDSATVEHLSALGCDQVQGYVFSRPLPSKAFADWITARSTSPGVLRQAA